MNGYVCFYRGKRIEVRAASSYAAQCEAARVLRLSDKQRRDVTVTLAERADGSTVVHPAGRVQ